MIHKVSTKNMSREEWLHIRSRTIGGSDAAGIVEMNHWTSPYKIWAEKTGRIEPPEDSEAMRVGRELEKYVAMRFEESTDKKVRRENHIIYNDLYPFAHANVDRLIVGEKAGLECKTTSSLNLAQFREGEYPENYYVQCVHYMAITGLERWYLAVLVLGKGFYTYCIERNQAEIDALMTAEAEFYGCVENDIPPDVDGSQATTDAIKVMYPDNSDIEADLSAVEAELKRLIELKKQINVLEEQKRFCENEIKASMKDAAFGRTDHANVSWKTQQRKIFNANRFCSEHPELDINSYYDFTNSRVFKVTEIKQREE